MQEQPPQIATRPSVEELAVRIADLKNKQVISANMFENIKKELEDMAAGGGAGHIRAEYFPGWEDEDFRTILNGLN
jgi:hypothetical protein